MTLPSTRAQTETLGVVLLLMITLAGTGLIVALGSSVLDDSKRAAELDSAEHAMTQLDSKASLVGIGETDIQRVNLGVGNDGQPLTRTQDGWMRVEVDPDDGAAVEVMNQTLGAVVYRNDQTTIAYQGGGVWRRTGEGSTMVSPPEFHYRETTLTLPLIIVGGDGGSPRVSKFRKTGVPSRNSRLQSRRKRIHSRKRRSISPSEVTPTAHGVISSNNEPVARSNTTIRRTP
ncbi:hypothetical protein ACFFQF_15195 [Haladaptatus pallidirubidus]|uniref:DUF7289 family protein n=1 Tax=Haladaptatus pallidirubidus TaxID=1008152 RepID=UPI0035EB38F9